jgi:hypothetical protein
MSAAHAYEDLHHLVDRLPLDQARRLLRLVKHDPELAAYAPEPAADLQEAASPRLASAGIFESGRGDLSERVEELAAERFNHSM